MKRKIIFGALITISALALTSCDLDALLKLFDSLTAGTSIDNSRENMSTNLSYIEEGENFTAALNDKYIYEDILDSNGNYPLRSIGNLKLLVIPVKIEGYENLATTANLDSIETAIFGEDTATGWQSVASYYKKSSYGALNLTGTVTDWYDCGLNASEIASLSPSSELDSRERDAFEPTWTILQGALTWYKATYSDNCTQFDNDGDGLIDGVWLVYGAPNYTNDDEMDTDTFWAYNYKDYSVEQADISSPVAYNYCWASYDFMFGAYSGNQIDAHTYIHETGHMLGLEDYYVSDPLSGEDNYGPMGAIDMMDYNIIDHNAWSKFALGWTHPYVVSGSTTIDLCPSATTGQAILLPTSESWNGTAFDEFILMEYYSPDVLNFQDSFYQYLSYPTGFVQYGVRIYHVDARFAVIQGGVAGARAQYDDEFTASEGDAAIIPQSNSSGTNQFYRDSYFASSPATNFLRFRLLQEMDATLKRNFDTQYQEIGGTRSSLFADNSTLFQDGDSFDYATYQDSFPNYVNGHVSTMNNGGTLPWHVEFTKKSDEASGITVTITKLN